MTDHELDRQLRDSMSALSLPSAPATLRSAVDGLDRGRLEPSRPRLRSRLGLLAAPVLGLALVAIAAAWWVPRAHEAPSSGSTVPTAAPSAVASATPAPSVDLSPAARLVCSHKPDVCADTVSLVRETYPTEVAEAAAIIVAELCDQVMCDGFYAFDSLVVLVPIKGAPFVLIQVLGHEGPEQVIPYAGEIPEHVLALVPPAEPLVYPEGCAAFELSIRRCAYIVEWAKHEAGLTDADPIEMQLLGDPDCPYATADCPIRTMSFVVRVRLVLPDGSTHDESVFCGPFGGHSLLCTETPVTYQRTPMEGYFDVPCAGEAPDNPCATPVPTPDPSALAAAEPLVVDSLSITIDHVGTYVVDLGQAVLPNGILSEATFSLADEMPDDFLVAPDGVVLRIDSLEGGEPFENIHAHGWRPGTERVEATLTFTIESFEPGAVLDVLDIIVR